jgi:hypothetical protein
MAGPLQVVAKPTSKGKLATGITFTALGGLAVVTGITLTGVGCYSEDRDGMCNAGMITGGLGGVVTLGAVWLMLQARSRVTVRPLFADRVMVGPGMVAGTF